MNAEEYIELRLDDQFRWYDRRAAWNQRWHKSLRVLEVCTAAAIPVVAGFSRAEPEVTLLPVAIMGAIVAVIAGLLGIYQFQENWIKYRTTAETLKHERFLFLTKTSPYDQEDSFASLVKRVEALVSEEHTDWANLMRGAGVNGQP